MDSVVANPSKARLSEEELVGTYRGDMCYLWLRWHTVVRSSIREKLFGLWEFKEVQILYMMRMLCSS